MTLAVHKIIDALITSGETSTATEIKRAEKFDFGQMPLEPMENETSLPGIQYRLPAMTESEILVWADGLLPLPANPSWFEFSLGSQPRRRTGLLLFNSEIDTFSVMSFVLSENRRIGVHNFVVQANMTECRAAKSLVMRASALKDADPAIVKEAAPGYMQVALYMLLMLYSKTTEIEPSRIPIKALNESLVRRGMSPRFSHRIVRIVPVRYIDRTGNGSHRSPRLHWRRTHLREFDHETLQSKWCEPRGKWCVVIPRHLVGKRELGEVTHDYHVQMQALASERPVIED